MKIEQQVIARSIHIGLQGAQLGDELNALAAEGWRVREVTTLLTRKGGAIFTLKTGYYFDTYLIVLEKTAARVSYRCTAVKRDTNRERDLQTLNAEIAARNAEGFRLLHLFHGSSISIDPARMTPGTIAHILLFEREDSG